MNNYMWHNIYICSHENCALPVITTMALWQFMTTRMTHCFHDGIYR